MSFNPFSVIDKNIIVTGASSGIGREVAITLSKLGARVCLLGRNKENLTQTRKLCTSPDKHLIFDFDLINSDSRLEFIKSLKEKNIYSGKQPLNITKLENFPLILIMLLIGMWY